MDMKTATRMYTLRRRKGLSQEELAEALGVTRQAVSKWERGESSPDTENLIALARLYGMSLDQLIGIEEIADDDPMFQRPQREYDAPKEEPKNQFEQSTFERAKEEPREQCYQDDPKQNDRFDIDVESKEGDRVRVRLGGIHIQSKDGSHVQMGGGKGFVVHDGEGNHVQMGGGKGFYVHDADGTEVQFGGGKGFHVTDNEMHHKTREWKEAWGTRKKPALVHILESPLFVFLTVGGYLTLGFMLGLWHPGWLLFLGIPIYYGMVNALAYKKPQAVPVAVLCAAAYLVAGLQFHHWHPSWVVFLLIPIYHGVVETITKIRKQKH